MVQSLVHITNSTCKVQFDLNKVHIALKKNISAQYAFAFHCFPPQPQKTWQSKWQFDQALKHFAQRENFIFCPFSLEAVKLSKVVGHHDRSWKPGVGFGFCVWRYLTSLVMCARWNGRWLSFTPFLLRLSRSCPVGRVLASTFTWRGGRVESVERGAFTVVSWPSTFTCRVGRLESWNAVINHATPRACRPQRTPGELRRTQRRLCVGETQVIVRHDAEARRGGSVRVDFVPVLT